MYEIPYLSKFTTSGHPDAIKTVLLHDYIEVMNYNIIYFGSIKTS